MNILFVCTGNTCRSPMAEALLRDKYPDVQVQSAGVFAMNGGEISKNTQIVLEEENITINHQSQPVTDDLLEWSDLVLTMTMQHKHALIIEHPDHQAKYFTLKEYVREQETKDLPSPNEYDISDPFGGDLETYRATRKELYEHIDSLIDKIK